jgi:hypothetical protein
MGGFLSRIDAWTDFGIACQPNAFTGVSITA